MTTDTLIPVSEAVTAPETTQDSIEITRLKTIGVQIGAVRQYIRGRIEDANLPHREPAASSVYTFQTGIEAAVKSDSAAAALATDLIGLDEEIEEALRAGIDIRRIWGLNFDEIYPEYGGTEDNATKEKANWSFLGRIADKFLASQYDVPDRLIHNGSKEDNAIALCDDISELEAMKEGADNRKSRLIDMQIRYLKQLAKRPHYQMEHFVTDDIADIMSSNDIRFLENIIKSGTLSTELEFKRKKAAAARIKLLHAASLVASRYGEKYTKVMNDLLIRRITSVRGVESHESELYYTVPFDDDAKLYIAPPKTLESVMRKVLAKGVTSENFDEVVRDQVRLTLTLDPEMFEGDDVTIMANLIPVTSWFERQFGSDIIANKTRLNITREDRSHNVNSNADRISVQYTLVFKAANRSKLVYGGDGASRMDDITLEIQLIPADQFTKIPEDPAYAECVVERRIYEAKSWAASAARTGLELTYEDYFKLIVNKALDLGTYNGCKNSAVVNKILKVVEKYNNGKDVLTWADDPATSTYKSVLECLTGESGAELANSLDLTTRIRLASNLRIVRLSADPNSGVITDLDNAITVLEAPRQIPPHS